MIWKSGALATLSLFLLGSCLGCDNQTEFACKRIQQCIALGWMCDGVADCRDGTDETDCNYMHPCPAGMYNCHDGDCVQAAWKCDGSIDCHNGRDEESCGNTLRATRVKTQSDNSSTSQTKKIAGTFDNSEACHETMYQCDGGACIHPGFRCDGQQDCPLGDDEKDCPSTKILCPENQRQCKTTEECIPPSWFCDGEFDCDDRSDEDGCDTETTNNAEPSSTTTSPEVVDSNEETNHTRQEGVCGFGQYQCKRSSQCIEETKTCDGIEDCPGGDDEAGACQDCYTLECVYDCKVTPKEAFCTCPKGMITDPQDFRNCIQDNPCLHQSHCAHFCKSTDDQNYICSCDLGFELDSDLHHCIPQTDSLGGELLFSVGNEIRVSSLHADATHASRYDIYSALDTGENLYHLAMDVHQNRLWAGIAGHTNEWRVARTENGELKSVRAGFPELGSIQFDWINRNVYFLTGGRRETPSIYACKENMLFCSKLVHGLRTNIDEHGRKHIQAFRGLALHPRRGLMCWIEIFVGQAKVKCANMDGSDVHTLIDRKLVDPTALVWDTLKNDLYVADAGNELIERINYDTREQRVIGRVVSPYAMTFFNGILYYSETELNVIKSLDVSTDHHLLPHIERSFSHRPFGLTVNHTLAQNSLGVEACPSALECQYACVSYSLGGKPLHSCLCPEGYETSPDSDCTFPEDVNDYKVDSFVDFTYMQELCDSDKACGGNGKCVYTLDTTTKEVERIHCECNVGFMGLACELADGKAVARALEGQETSFVTMILLVFVFLIILLVAFFCIREKHQPFREFTKSTKEAFLDSSPQVLQAIRNGVQHVHQKIVTQTSKNTAQSREPTTESFFSSPVFEDAKQNTMDAEIGSPFVKKTPLSTKGGSPALVSAKGGSPALVSASPAPPVPSNVKSVFGNFENPTFGELSPTAMKVTNSPDASSWELSAHRSQSHPVFLADEYEEKAVY